MITGKKIVLGVTGGIACYRAVSVCSQLVKRGADVHVVMTEAAKKFVTALTFQTMSRNFVMDDTFIEENPRYISHIEYAKADLILVAPATANTIGKIANGLGDSMLTNILLATRNRSKVLICPAMNTDMLYNPAVQENIEKLRTRGYNILSPVVGELACGVHDEGALPDPRDIIAEAERLISNREA